MFLGAISDAFIWRDADKLKLNPADTFAAIYRSHYPRWHLGGDTMELETLAQSLQRQYGYELGTMWHEQLTLGEVFASLPKKSVRDPTR
ncbi:hypothetical protein KSF73_10795 [Burkholderiaceae bacterium DAT-1]|nr:hypothetical protein [Burkholderiaceae bacterium DAT-1]